MPAIIAALLQGLRWLLMSRLGLFIVTALTWLGINLSTVNLILEPTMELLENFAQGQGGGGEYFAIAQQWGGVLHFDDALTMVISAYVTKQVVMQGRLFLFRRGVGAP